jgi:hypothetical protein
MSYTDIGTTHPLGLKLIFLDIDGVLNSSRYAREQALKARRKPMNRFLQRTASEIDPAAVACLNEIVRRSGARIVITSSWRLRHSLKHISRCLRKRGYDGPQLLGSTPIVPGMTRGYEVAKWLGQNFPLALIREPFVILDDAAVDHEKRLAKHLVRTSYEEGLTAAHVPQALAALGVS